MDEYAESGKKAFHFFFPIDFTILIAINGLKNKNLTIDPPKTLEKIGKMR